MAEIVKKIVDEHRNFGTETTYEITLTCDNCTEEIISGEDIYHNEDYDMLCKDCLLYLQNVTKDYN